MAKFRSNHGPRDSSWYSEHAKKRRQQRGISQEAIYVVAKYGKPRYSNGAITIAMDKATRRKAERDMGRKDYKQVEDNLGIYLVRCPVSGLLVTVAHRTRRFRSP